MHPGKRLEAGSELAGETGRARGGAQDDDEIASADPSPAGTAKTGEGAGRLRALDGRARAKRFFVEGKRFKPIRKIRLRRKSGAGELPHGERFEHGLIAHIITRGDIRERDAERKAPGEQRLARGDRADSEAMAFKNGMREHAGGTGQLDGCAHFEPASGNSDVVA